MRDTDADLLKEVCRDVRVEQILQPTRGDLLSSRANTADQARLDIAATGLWSRFERTFFDVRVTHPNAPSNRPKTLKQLYARNETEKKMKYAQRVINTEKGSFCPLVYIHNIRRYRARMHNASQESCTANISQKKRTI